MECQVGCLIAMQTMVQQGPVKEQPLGWCVEARICSLSKLHTMQAVLWCSPTWVGTFQEADEWFEEGVWDSSKTLIWTMSEVTANFSSCWSKDRNFHTCPISVEMFLEMSSIHVSVFEVYCRRCQSKCSLGFAPFSDNNQWERNLIIKCVLPCSIQWCL